MAMTYLCIVINVVIYIHYSMVTALGSIVTQELIFRNKILLLLLLLELYKLLLPTCPVDLQ